MSKTDGRLLAGADLRGECWDKVNPDDDDATIAPILADYLMMVADGPPPYWLVIRHVRPGAFPLPHDFHKDGGVGFETSDPNIARKWIADGLQLSYAVVVFTCLRDKKNCKKAGLSIEAARNLAAKQRKEMEEKKEKEMKAIRDKFGDERAEVTARFYDETMRLARAGQVTEEKVAALAEEFQRQLDALPKYTPMAVGMKPKVVTNAGEIVSDLSVRLNPGDPNWRGEERLVVLKSESAGRKS